VANLGGSGRGLKPPTPSNSIGAPPSLSLIFEEEERK